MIGPYKIQRTLGEGGFGRTYLAEHVLLGKPAVIKQSLYRGDLARDILLREASLLWDVHHWALPTVKDVMVNDDGDLLMAMSFVPGAELMRQVAEHGPVELETACWIGQRVLSALHYLHHAGIVHRDVKPANIIVNFDTHLATLVDFGLSKLRPDGSPDPSGFTPIFGAPEQAAGKAPIPESDIHGLGMSLIHILGGDVRAHVLPSVPPAMRDFLAALVREDPRRRPGDCKKLNEQLGELRRALFGRDHSL